VSEIVEKEPKARVFISCGQRDGEKQYGLKCQEYLKGRSFETYFAEKVQSLDALTENIFRHLRNSEYAVFIDFRRDSVGADGKFRGSMFVNQELAIAAFLQIESIVFHQSEVRREGVADYLIAKPVHFSTEEEFLSQLQKETRDWHSNWRNELALRSLIKIPDVKLKYPGQDAIPPGWQLSDMTDWYHLPVKNEHQDKYARNCAAYITEITDLGSGKITKPDSFELVWAGTGLYEKRILPQTASEIDAFYIVHSQDVIRFHHRPSTSSQFSIPSLPMGSYLITYLVISENFESVIKTLKIEFGGNKDQVKFSEWNEGK